MSKLSSKLLALRLQLIKRLVRRYGFHSVAQRPANDLALVAYPKSGTTWLQNMMVGVLYGIQPRLAPNELVQSLIPDEHTVPFYRRLRGPNFFKTHALPRAKYRRVIYLLRDGRDVAVSYRYFLEARRRQRVEFSQLVGPAAQPWPCKWHEHVERWLDNPFQADMLVVRYENLQADAVRELQRICRFTGLERTVDELRDAASNASISHLRKQEAQFAGGGSLNGKTFFRRGRVGSFEDELPPEVLSQFIAEAGDCLSRCGYRDELDPETTCRDGLDPAHPTGTDPIACPRT